MCSPKMQPQEHEAQERQQAESSSSSDSGSSRQENELVGKPKGLSNESYALLLLLLSAILFCFMSAFVKLATDTGLPSTEIIFVRAILQGFLIVMGMCWFVDESNHHSNHSTTEDDDENNSTKNRQIRVWEHPFGHAHVRHIVIARGAFGGLAFVLFYYTYSQLPIGDANTLLSLNPVVTAIFASLVLGEPMHMSQILAAGLSFVGSLLIARPEFLFDEEAPANHLDDETETNFIWGYLSAILGTCLFSAVIILVRKAGTSGVHTLQLMFSWSFFSLVFSGLIGILLPHLSNSTSSTFYFPNTTVWMYILGCLFTGATASFILNYAGRVAPAGLTAIVRSSTILFSYILQMIVFAEIPSVMTIMGASLILLSLITIAIQKINDEKRLMAQKHLDEHDKSHQEQVDEENQKHTQN